MICPKSSFMYLIVSVNISYRSRSFAICAWPKASMIPNREWKRTSGSTFELSDVNESVGTALNSPYSWRFGDKVNPDRITVGLSQHIEQDVILDFASLNYVKSKKFPNTMP